MFYKAREIYIYATYRIVFKEPYYDEYYDMYLQDVYYIFNGLSFIIKKDNKFIDVLNNKEISKFSFGMKQNDVFIGKNEAVYLSEYLNKEYKDVEIYRKQLKELALDIIPILEKRLRLFNDNAHVITGPFELGNRTLIQYYNDHDGEDYYDEAYEYRKQLIYNGMRNKEQYEDTDYDEYLM